MLKSIIVVGDPSTLVGMTINMNILSLFKKSYHPLNTIEVSSKALLFNYEYLSSLNTSLQIAPVLKSNAYGHGLVNVAKVLDRAGAPFFCVDSIYEGYELLKNHIKTPILIMGYIKPENLKVKKLPFSYAVYNSEQVIAISKHQPHAGIHIFVDTGMHREGIALSDLPEFLEDIRSNNLNVEGLMSHLGSGADAKNVLTEKQLKNFEDAQEIIKANHFAPKWIHIAASEALLNHAEYEGRLGNVGRSGIAVYGIDPNGEDKNLLPALKFVSTLTQIKSLKKGEKVGYDFTYTAKEDMTIGVLPLGYYDGLERRLSNKGFVSINNILCQIIGRVSMNLTTIDISAVKNPEGGERVVVYSDNPTDKNSISNAAIVCETISYDILVGLASPTKRTIIS